MLEVDVVSLASEFPNDNPALHRGVIWVNTEPTGAARPERPSLVGPSEHTVLDERDPTSASTNDDDASVVIDGSASESSLVMGDPPSHEDGGAPDELPIELAASKRESLAPPEDDEIDESAGPIVVEELEPIEASVEGEANNEDAHPETSRFEGAAVVVEGDEPNVTDVAPAVTPEVIVDVDVTSEVQAVAVAVAEIVADVPAAESVEAPASIPSVVDSNDAEEHAAPVPAQSEVVLAGTRVDAHEDDTPEVAITPVFDEVVASEVPRETTSLPPAPDDPFTVLVCTLADVAIGAGSPHVASLLPGLLFDGRLPESLDAGAAEALRSAALWDGNEVAPAFVAVTAAWRAILRGTSNDFDACGAAMLDEWAAELLARLLEAPARAPMFRQELRSRGVAAFGLAA